MLLGCLQVFSLDIGFSSFFIVGYVFCDNYLFVTY